MSARVPVYANESDGALSIDGVVVATPDAEFPAVEMRRIVRAVNAHAKLVAALGWIVMRAERGGRGAISDITDQVRAALECTERGAE